MNNMLSKSITVILGAILLMFVAFFNEFPILNNDLGTSIISAYELKAPIDRPIFYGLFIRMTSMGFSLWMTAFAQALIIAYLLKQVVYKFINPCLNYILVIIYISSAVLAFGSWFTSLLLPDIFTAVLFLALYLFLQGGSLKDKVLLYALVMLSLTVHSSHILIAFLFLASVLVFAFIYKNKYLLKQILYISTTLLLSWVLLSYSNYKSGNSWTINKSSHVFLMGRLVESGIAAKYLNDNCSTHNYKLCAFKESLPSYAWEFIWNDKNPIQLTGGWDANKEEYNDIFKGILSTPEYYPLLITKSISATFSQLSMYYLSDMYAGPQAIIDENQSCYQAINKHYYSSVNDVKKCKQNSKQIPYDLWRNIQFIYLLASSLVVLLLYNKMPVAFKWAYLYLFAFLFINAFVTANLSAVLDRYNARVFWLVGFLNILYIMKCASGTFLKRTQ